MAYSLRLCCKKFLKISIGMGHFTQRYSNTVAEQVVEKHRHSLLSSTTMHIVHSEKPCLSPRDFRFVFPEFLPNPEIVKRDRLSEKLERRDMLNRRAVMSIPEFYVGSILAVRVADFHASNKQNRFVGICIQRVGHGLRANFTLRNIVDGQGVEITYDLYSPVLQKIEVLKLERRLDDELLYLRDAPAEYSTFSFDLAPVSLPTNGPVPINSTKVKLGPRPWSERWERKNLKGIEDLALPQRFYDRALHPQIAQPWRKRDLMQNYRETINELERDEIIADVSNHMKKSETKHKMSTRKDAS